MPAGRPTIAATPSPTTRRARPGWWAGARPRAGSRREVRLKHPHGGVPVRVPVLLLGQDIVAIGLPRVPLQRGREQVVDLLVAHFEAPPLVLGQLDRDRLRAPVQVHVPAMRMPGHPLVVGDVQHERTLSRPTGPPGSRPEVSYAPGEARALGQRI